MSSTQNVSGLATIDACAFFKRFAADAAAEPGSRGFGTFVSNVNPANGATTNTLRGAITIR